MANIVMVTTLSYQMYVNVDNVNTVHKIRNDERSNFLIGMVQSGFNWEVNLSGGLIYVTEEDARRILRAAGSAFE